MHLPKKLSPGILLLSLATAGALSAQSVSIVGGDGAILAPLQSSVTLTVLVKNAQGQPAPFGTVVTWVVSGAAGAIQNSQSSTDANGQATNLFFSNGPLLGVSYSQSIVTASSAIGGGVNFTETISGTDLSATNPFVTATLISPNLGDTFSGAAGSSSLTTVKAQVFANGFTSSSGVPNVLLKLVPVSATGPTIGCSGNSGYSDASGNINCIPVFGGSTGSGQFFIDIGQTYRQFGPFNFTVTASAVSTIRITGGNNQTGNPGSTLPLPLTAHVEDISGIGLPNIPVVWEIITGNPTIINSSASSDSGGNVSATIQLGSIAGPVQIRVRTSDNQRSAIFTEQSNFPVTGVTKGSGDGQIAVTGQPFAQPLIVQVNNGQGAASNVQLQFTSSGGVTLANNGLATTNAQGQASMTVTAGPTAGPVTVTASVSGFIVSFSLTVRLPGPQISSNSFFNGAGGQPGGVSPSAVLAIYGPGIGPGLQGCVNDAQIVGGLPLLVAKVTVLFTAGAFTEYAPIYAVCNLGVGQEYVVIQVPSGLPVGTTSITVRQDIGQTQVDNVPVTVVSPGIFETVMSDNTKRAVILHADGGYVTLENRARPGEKLRAFVTGLGRPVTKSGFPLGTNQAGVPGDDAAPLPAIIVGLNNEGVTPTAVKWAEDLIGVYQVDFVAPTTVPSGANIPFAVADIINDSFVFGNPSKIPF